MSGDRYSRIIEASRYKKALDNYIDYVSGLKDRQTKIGEGGARPDRQDLYIKPFGTTLGTKQYAQVSAYDTAWTSHSSKFTGYTKSSLDTAEGDSSLKLKGLSPARLSYKSGIASTGTVKTSKVTGLKYLSYGGSSVSVPFGQKAGTTVESQAFDSIRASFGNLPDSVSITWIREKY